MKPILEVSDLSVNFYLTDLIVMAVRDVSFHINKGETLGLVGESGCGKSVTAYSIINLISPPGNIESGKILFRDKDIIQMEDEDLRKVRGNEIAMIFQEPMSSLNPVFTIGYQIAESILLHLKMNKSEAREYTVELLNQVGIPNSMKRYDSYPHEFSGGMRQRAMIAMALSASPSILIADEPTTALDVTIQAQILELLIKIQEAREMSLLLITHDLGVVANIADKIAIMYAGEIVEYGTTREIFNHPFHPYTKGLFDAIPKIGENRGELKTIPGTVPTVTAGPTGCVFYPRCTVGSDDCLKNPIENYDLKNAHTVRCIRARG